MIINYFLADAETGRIVRSGTIQEELLEQLTGLGEVAIICDSLPDAMAQYYDIAANELRTIPVQPGEFYAFDFKTKQWILDFAMAEEIVRATRNSWLLASDWTQLPDVPEHTRTIWQAYRQELRDISKQSGFPTSITWPEFPQ